MAGAHGPAGESPSRLVEYALALNDSIVQGLAAAKMSLELNQVDRALTTIDGTLRLAQSIIAELLHEVGTELRPGDLVREPLKEGDSDRS